MKNMLTTSEVAKRLDCTVVWVQMLCKSGRLKHERFGRAYLIYESAADAYQPQPRGKPPQKKRTKSETNGYSKVGVGKAKKVGRNEEQNLGHGASR